MVPSEHPRHFARFRLAFGLSLLVFQTGGYDLSPHLLPLSFALTSTPLAPTAASTRPTRRQHPTLAEAKRLIESQQAETAIPKLKEFIRASPSSRYADEAYLLVGSALLSTQRQEEAIPYLERILKEFPKSDLVYRARILLASAHADLGHLDQALPLLSEVRSLAPDTQSRREALTLTGELLTRKGDYLRAIQAWLEEMRLAPEDQRGVSRDRIRGLVMEKLDRKTLLRVRDSYRSEFPGDLALIRLVDLELSRKEQHLAERHLRLFLKRFPNHDYATTASETLRSFTTQLREAQHVIVALLPLSGRLSSFGTESLRGIQLALDKGREVLNLPSIALAVKDTATNKVYLRSELYELIDDFRPIAVIGPMESREVQTLAELAERTETPFFTPSATLQNVRLLGNFVFSTALTYWLQTRRIAEYAMSQLGHHRFCILYPDTVYGRELTRLFSQEVRQRGGEIIAVELYREKDTDFGPQIKRLKAEDLARDGILTETKIEDGEPRVIYTPGFDAIFIPGRAREVALITAQLVFFDIKTPLLGTNGWNSPALLRLVDRSIDGSVFVDGFYLDSLAPDIQDFIGRYRRQYQRDPSPFAAQAYDATSLVLDAVRRGATSAREVREKMVNGQDLPALGGTARFDARGILNRRLFVLQVRQGKIMPAEQPVQLLEPAP